jgi:DNA invertase Pin-like site-specific DNA recombinase
MQSDQSYAHILQSSCRKEANKKYKIEKTIYEFSCSLEAKKKSKTEKGIDELRNGKFLTQRKIAERVGCHEQFVSQVKRQRMMEDQPPWFHNHVSKVHQF